MSQCVPSWDLDDNPPPAPPKFSLRSNSNSNSCAPDVPMLDYEVAELTWENGQISMHGLGPPRVPAKPIPTTNSSKYTWEKPRAGGTLESIVNQATCLPQRKLGSEYITSCYSDVDAVPWFEHHRTPASSATMTMDALVPCSNRTDDRSAQGGIGGKCVLGSSTRVGSCSGPTTATQEEQAAKRGRVARVPVAAEGSNRELSVSGSATFGRESRQVTLDTCEREVGVGFTSTSSGSHENTSCGKQTTKTATVDENDSVCHSTPQVYNYRIIFGGTGCDAKKQLNALHQGAFI